VDKTRLVLLHFVIPDCDHIRIAYQQYSQHQTNTQMTGMTLSLQLQVPGWHLCLCQNGP